MLSPRRIAATAIAAAMLATALLVTTSASPAGAKSPPVTCPPPPQPCVIQIGTPGGPGIPGGPGGGGGGGQCSHGGLVLPCYSDLYGWFDSQNGCYYKELSPQPPPGDPVWAGHTDGAVYLVSCNWLNGRPATQGISWLATPPPGFGGPVATPAQLAQEAIKMLDLHGPDIGSAPDAAGAGLVGLPVWLWTVSNAHTWGPLSATASVPGLSVTATANAQRIVWSMGDGHSISCTSPGTVYHASYGNVDSPTCGYRYAHQGRYQITATTTWRITWAGGGASGVVITTRTSTTALHIEELQVLTK